MILIFTPLVAMTGIFFLFKVFFIKLLPGESKIAILDLVGKANENLNFKKLFIFFLKFKKCLSNFENSYN